MKSLGKIDVSPVLGAGREIEVRQAVRVPDFESYVFPDTAGVALTVRRLGRGLELTGTVDAVAAGVCARCLDDVRLPIHLDVSERFEPAGDRSDPLDDNNVLKGDELDLEDLVRQLLDSALPLILHCTNACGGLCAVCGKKRDGSCRCSQTDAE